jgi:KaiC/GvpD/RAD55 family RecA-like ATPase
MQAMNTEAAVSAILGLLRLLWRDSAARTTTAGTPPSAITDHMELAARLRHECPQVPAAECDALVDDWLRIQRDGCQSTSVGFPRMCEMLLPPYIYSEDARYFAMRSIRRAHRVLLSSNTAAAAHHLARNLSALLSEPGGESIDFSTFKSSLIVRLKTEQFRDDAERIFEVFIDVCLVLDLLTVKADCTVTLARECADAEYLINHLFGVPTRITGFDAIFGGGLMFTDSIPPAALNSTEDPPPPQMIGGRSVLCIGPFGSGKTLLSLQIAVEVARKGGVAWIIAFEQTEEECLYSLEAIGVTTFHRTFRVVTGGLTESFLALSDPSPTTGALVFLRPSEFTSDDEPTDYFKFLNLTRERLSWMARYPLRLLVVDPVNAIAQPALKGLRVKTQKLFEAAKRANVNIWFTSEHLTDRRESSRFEENIADTVIQLGSDYQLGQPRRYIEVTKSRFQQEATGRHGLVIDSVNGLSIYPSSALVARLTSSRTIRAEGAPLKLGISGIESLLGSELIRQGDVIVLAGHGKGKTLLGAHFLMEAVFDEGEARSLFVTDNPVERMDRLLSIVAESKWSKLKQRVERCSLPTGYVDPGRILWEIEAALKRCQGRDARPIRTLLSTVSRWEEEMPFVAADTSFGLALVKLLRSYNAAALVVCGDDPEGGSQLRDALIDQSDIFLQFDRIELQGRVRSLVRAVKSRRMTHQRASYEVIVDSKGASICPSPLFRIRPSGEILQLKITLFLHAETENHKKFNDRIVEGLKAAISAEARIEAQDRTFDPGFLSLSQYSAIDELQIFQIDEYQLPTTKSTTLALDALHSFSSKVERRMLEDRLPHQVERVVHVVDGRERFLAVPFYTNLSLLVVYWEKFDKLPEELKWTTFPNSWEELAKHCAQFDAAHPNDSDLFFSCPVADDAFETYNCLFFEILASLAPPAEEDLVDLSHWLDAEVTREYAKKAACLFHRLCRKSHAKRKEPQEGIVARHWFNTLNQVVSKFDSEKRDRIKVQPLFGNLTTAGDWYLAIPAHSASPEVGLRLIEHLTSPALETARLELGVGLPTRRAFFEAKGGANTSVSPYFDLSPADLNGLMKNALRRSKFHGYQSYTNTISSHLRWILELPMGEDKSDSARILLQTKIGERVRTLAREVQFLGQSASAPISRSGGEMTL